MTTNLKLNTANWFKKQLLLLGLFILAMLPLVGHAQQYPVRIIPVITPPYSLKLADYAHAPESKLQLQVLMTDLQQPQHHIGIKFFLQAGLNAQPIAQSNEFIIGQKPFLLTPGANITLTSSQIKHLFDPQNLNGLNPQQYASPLPEGLYQFCFQAYDFYTKNNLSDKACASVFLNQYDPPQLNIPQNAEKIQAINPYGNGSGILFQWMPRQVAPNTKYNFILKEIWDTNQSPISAFLASPVLWKEETFAPNLYYSIDKTQLIPGRRYAWQVQAFSSNPFDNFNYPSNNQIQSANYKNNGLSEIFFFDYVENCPTPTFLIAKNKGRGRVEIQWSLVGKPNGLFKIQYRKKGANTPWFNTETYQNSAFINGLEDLTEYEYRVGAVCGNVVISNSQFENNENAYAFSPVQFFTTDSQDVQNNNFQCGVMPAVDISNKEPLRQSLVANDTFTAGDFPVTIIDAQGSNGIFTGTGFIQVPYLADTKIKVAFQNITINSDKKLISGTLETEYDPNETAVHFASTGLGELFGDAGIKDITLDYNVSNVQFIATPPPGKIIIIGDNGKENNDDTGSATGSTQELPAGRDYTIVDKNGNIWSVDEDGNITSGGTLADGGKSTPENTEGLSPKGDIEQCTAKGINLSWDASNSIFEYDTPEISGLKDKGNYKLVKNTEGKTVAIPFKAIVNGETDFINAKVAISDKELKDAKIVFKALKSGKKFDAEQQGTGSERVYKITLKGIFNYGEETLTAVLLPKDSTRKQKIISAFNLVHLEKKKINLALVPLDEKAQNKIDSIKNNIIKIYSRIGVEFDIKTQKVMNISDIIKGNTIDTEDTDYGKTYSKQQELINNRYKADNEDRYVLFITSKNASKGQKGYFRLNGQFGYIFGNADNKTPAHEVGHGVFKLEHPWTAYGTNQGSTNLLMDYSQGQILSHLDWKQIGDPKLKLYAFQEQNEGEYVITELDYICTNDIYQHKVDRTYLDLDGNRIKLKSNYRPYAFVGSLSQKYKGRLAIIQEINSKKLYYPIASIKENKTGYMGYDAFNNFNQKFNGFTTSSNTPTIVYANQDCEYFENENSLGKNIECRKCEGLPSVQGERLANTFTINKNTFSLPQTLEVTASDENEIKENMPIIIDNDRRKSRTDKQDMQSSTNTLPTKKAENTYKMVATLWNHYQKPLYQEYLQFGRNYQNVREVRFNFEKEKLDNKTLLMPNLIADGTLGNISEQFIKDFFEDKIKGYVHHPDHKESSYNSNKKTEYERAGSDLVHHFYKNTGEPYYKTKTIAEAIYKTEKGKETINNMIKLIDQVFQYQMSKPKEKINAKNFLDKPLDNSWFDKGIDVQTFPSFGTSAFTSKIEIDNFDIKFGIDEEKLGLYTIGGTQAAKVAIKKFNPIIKNDEIGYEATIILQYLDTFGVSEDDYTKDLGIAQNVNFVNFNYRGGVMAQWVLQHQYGYKPFNDFLTYTIKMKKLWKQ